MFGDLSLKLLFDYKPFSADASTWARAVGYGKLYYWDPEDKKPYPINLGEREGSKGNGIAFDSFHHKNQFESFLNHTFGFNRTQLMSDYAAKQIVNLYYFKQLENIINAQSK